MNTDNFISSNIDTLINEAKYKAVHLVIDDHKLFVDVSIKSIRILSLRAKSRNFYSNDLRERQVAMLELLPADMDIFEVTVYFKSEKAHDKSIFIPVNFVEDTAEDIAKLISNHGANYRKLI